VVDQCDNCAYIRQRQYEDKYVMECRYGAPSTTSRQGQRGQWPEVKATDWCGEYEAIGSDLGNTYLSGNLILTTTTKVKLMESTDPNFPKVAMVACQITNVANQPCLVEFFDGNTTDMITQLGCASQQSDQFLFAFPLGAGSGSIWCALRTAATEVYVAAQGRALRS
jgi:hypothetical protein